MSCLWLAVLAAGSVSADDLERATDAAAKLARDGQYDLARRQLEMVAGLADESQRGDLLLEACELAKRASGSHEARRCYRILAESYVNQVGASAAYRAAALLAEQGDVAGAQREARALIVDGSDTDAAGRALTLLARLSASREEEVRDLVEVAAALAPRDTLDKVPRQKRTLAAQAWVTAARRSLDEGGAQKALELLDQGEAAITDTVWLDDAQYTRAQALRALHRYAEAVLQLESLRDAHKSSWLVGSYDSQYYDDALYDLGSTYLAMGDAARAKEAFADVLERTPTSRYTDDARFALGRLALERGDRGPLRRFLDDYPDSRHAAEAHRLLDAR